MPPSRHAARRRLRSAARATASEVYRDAILEAAGAEFSARGYAATKMLDVARRAGMSVGALYTHFENKEAIFVSLIERASVEIVRRLERAIRESKDPREQLTRLIAENLAFIEENRPLFLVFYQIGDADKASCSLLAEEASGVRTRIFGYFRDALANGVKSGTLRDDVSLEDQLSFLTGTVHGFLESWIHDGGSYRLTDKAELAARLVLRALGGGS